ncbi:hypothetical protein B0H14DRAFT_3461330 [Mycena olivaceomarginata]|nr:hypothetical protein B0H14DRAFT_3461330 [Mycena olivaceomarginata]
MAVLVLRRARRPGMPIGPQFAPPPPHARELVLHPTPSLSLSLSPSLSPSPRSRPRRLAAVLTIAFVLASTSLPSSSHLSATRSRVTALD